MTDTDRIAEIEQVLHGLNTPPPSVERVRARQNLLEHGLSYLSYLLDRLKSEREARQQFISDVSEGMECLPGCDSHGHEEGCPVADPMAAFRNLRENLQRAEAQCERLTVAARDAERVMAKHIYPKPDVAVDHPYAVLCRLREALAAQPQENDDEETDA